MAARVSVFLEAIAPAVIMYSGIPPRKQTINAIFCMELDGGLFELPVDASRRAWLQRHSNDASRLSVSSAQLRSLHVSACGEIKSGERAGHAV
jgi:hypothetical protein